jgi:hypothetical protein
LVTFFTHFLQFSRHQILPSLPLPLLCRFKPPDGSDVQSARGLAPIAGGFNPLTPGNSHTANTYAISIICPTCIFTPGWTIIVIWMQYPFRAGLSLNFNLLQTINFCRLTAINTVGAPLQALPRYRVLEPDGSVNTLIFMTRCVLVNTRAL